MASKFDLIEAPAPGWTTREIRQNVSSDGPPTWTVRLAQTEGHKQVEFTAGGLHVAWVRAVERAGMIDKNLLD